MLRHCGVVQRADPFQGEHFMASLVVFLPEPQRGRAVNSPDFPTEPAPSAHFIVPAR